eukprot:1377648-Amorphochlora_amoeboformis.AAC.2
MSLSLTLCVTKGCHIVCHPVSSRNINARLAYVPVAKADGYAMAPVALLLLIYASSPGYGSMPRILRSLFRLNLCFYLFSYSCNIPHRPRMVTTREVPLSPKSYFETWGSPRRVVMKCGRRDASEERGDPAAAEPKPLPVSLACWMCVLGSEKSERTRV